MNKATNQGKPGIEPLPEEDERLTREEFHRIVRKAAQPREKGKSETSESRRDDDYTENNTR